MKSINRNTITANCYKKRIVFFVLLLSIFPFLKGQATYTLKITSDTTSLHQLKEISYPSTFQSESELSLILEQLLEDLRTQTYYAASIDSIQQQDSLFVAYLFLGNAYENFVIATGNIAPTIWKKTGLDRFLNRPISYTQVQALQEELVKYGENNGYPFTAVQLADIQIKEATIKSTINWNRGRFIQIGDIVLEGSEVVQTAYLENYLGIRKGQIFNKEQLENAFEKLQELPFLRSTRTPAILFKEDQAELHFFLEPLKANRFDFLIGVLPNNQESGKVVITADIDAAFYNQFGKGEQFRFQFEQLRPETQALQLAATYPYLLQTPLGIDVEFGLYKRDSLFRDVNWNIGLQYQFASHHYLKAFSKNSASSLLTINKNSILQTKELPANLDTRYTAFGLAYYREQLDYRLNPRKGWTALFSGSAGFKDIRKNATISELVDPENPTFSFASLYDALELNSFQYQISTQLATYFALQKRSTLKVSAQAASIIANNPIAQNEQFRIGGAHLLRGFDEQSIFATTYGILTIEYRYLIGRRSYFNVFSDLAWLQNKTLQNDFTSQAIGLGAGMNFETKAGVFGISYALGKQGGESFDFRAAKLHFGLVSLF